MAPRPSAALDDAAGCSGRVAVAVADSKPAMAEPSRVVFAFCRRASVLTIEYSMNAPNTKTRQVAIQTSIAFVNETAGNRPWPELCVVIVSIVRMPSEMRAGTDSRSIQKDTQDSRTTSRLGRNVDRM